MPKPINECLRELRLEKGATQKEVASFLNMTEGAYRHYESGRCEPDARNLIALADYYEVSLDVLMGRYK